MSTVLKTADEERLFRVQWLPSAQHKASFLLSEVGVTAMTIQNNCEWGKKASELDDFAENLTVAETNAPTATYTWASVSQGMGSKRVTECSPDFHYVITRTMTGEETQRTRLDTANLHQESLFPVRLSTRDQKLICYQVKQKKSECSEQVHSELERTDGIRAVLQWRNDRRNGGKWGSSLTENWTHTLSVAHSGTTQWLYVQLLILD